MSTIREFDGSAGMDWGVGFDSVSGEVRGDCIIRPEPSNPPNTGQETLFTLQQLESFSSLYKSMQISASASLKTAFGSGSLKASYASSQNIHQYSIFLLVSVKVVNAATRLRDVKLKDDCFDLY